MTNETKKTSIGRRVARASLYMVPGYPVYKAFQSAKETASSGAKTLRDLHNELERQRPTTRHVRTYREALAVRPADALPLPQIMRKCLNSKRVCLLVAYLCLLYFIYGVVGGDFLAVFNSVFGAMLPLLFTVKYEHQLWQLESGPQRPDEPLGSYRDFFRSRGALLRLVNPRLF
ncbi:hypothetical protein [Paraburkholderia sp. BL21I4N1]|uniref:hypothetical protein n=1 Tax=Paraburkholderia sp. BL21I4N1 TaxID=1938801 RepID=UPI000CFE1D44|nr:hypothetical protein [Paraburkholderia sp. BL21I4N1]PQV45157.1 hypothetical protein B0G83_11870 [Paraburkholderia sp. BL21I4N1]